MEKQLWWQRGNEGATTNSKQQSTNVQHTQQPTSDDGRMRWRMTAAEETRQMEQWTSNYGRWQRGNNDADNNDKKQQSTNVRWQRRRTCAGAEVEEDNGWQEAGHGGGGRGVTVVRRRRRNSFAIGPWRMEVEDGRGCSFFSFLGEVESYLQSYLDKS
jgi:hypothetical protein